MNWNRVLAPYVQVAEINAPGLVTGATSGTALSITHGWTILPGDLVIAMIQGNNTANIDDNNGATPFTESIEEATLDASRYAIFYRVAGASEPAAYAFTLTVSNAWGYMLRLFRGADQVTPWDVAPSTSSRTQSATGTTATAPAATVGFAGGMGLCIFFTDQSSGNVYSGYTNGYGNELENPTTRVMASVTKANLPTGSTGTTAATIASSQDWSAFQVVIRPAVNFAARVHLGHAVHRAATW